MLYDNKNNFYLDFPYLEIITNLYDEHYSLSDILISIIKNCVYFVKNEEQFKLVNYFISNIILFYSYIINDNDKNELNKDILDNFHQDSHYNNYLFDIWANIIFKLNKKCIFIYNNLKILNYFDDDDLIYIFKILKSIIKLDNDALNIFNSFTYINDNKTLFDKIMNDKNIIKYYKKYFIFQLIILL